jgi:hypothetical protein
MTGIELVIETPQLLNHSGAMLAVLQTSKDQSGRVLDFKGTDLVE